MNALDRPTLEELRDRLAELADDAEARVVVLTGAGGKAFVAGTDITQFKDFKAREDGVKYEERLDAVLDRLERHRLLERHWRPGSG